MVTRAELDDVAARPARPPPGPRCGCRAGCSSVLDDDVVETDAGPLRAGVVIAADGTSSRLAREVGVRLSRVDLGLELELDAGPLGGGVGGPGAPRLGTDPGLLRLGLPQGRHPHRRRDRGPRAPATRPGTTCARFVALARARAAPRRARLRPPDPLPHAGLAAGPRPGAAGRRRRRAARAVDPRGHLVRHPLRRPGRRGRRGAGRPVRSSATAPRCRATCCPRWPPASAACAPSRPARAPSTS